MTENVDLQPNLPVSKVTVVDIQMPFSSMVVFMVKWAVAAIPALIILFVIGGMVLGLLVAVPGLPWSRTALTGYDSSVTPTLAGLRSVVISKRFDCIDAPSNTMRRLSNGRWQLQCPGEAYEILLSPDGDVLDVRRSLR